MQKRVKFCSLIEKAASRDVIELKVAANKNELFYVLKNGLFTQVSKEQAVAHIVTIEYRYCEYKPKPCEPMVYNAI